MALGDYWKRPLRGTIQCYVVRNLDAWHDRELPHPMARILIGRIGGAAMHRPADSDDSGQAGLWSSRRHVQAWRSMRWCMRTAARRLARRARCGIARVWPSS